MSAYLWFQLSLLALGAGRVTLEYGEWDNTSAMGACSISADQPTLRVGTKNESKSKRGQEQDEPTLSQHKPTNNDTQEQNNKHRFDTKTGNTPMISQQKFRQIEENTKQRITEQQKKFHKTVINKELPCQT